MVIHYLKPQVWLKYDILKIAPALVEAKAAVTSLANVPYQRAWAEKLQSVQLKQEAAGTSRIEGAEFTENELDAAISNDVSEDELTRSQKQARAAVNTYRWIANLEDDRPISADLVRDIHRRIVTGCDDDHCEPGGLRKDGDNVTFGSPRHRGAEGGKDCADSFNALIDAANREFRAHDILVQALGFHYHIGAMHPFLDGNGRTARATEALMLQRAGLKDGTFIALSNYYYDEKQTYLKTLALVKQADGDLTEFLIFGLKGIAFQCRRLLKEINTNISKALFRDISSELFSRLASTRKRVIARRQLALIHLLLESDELGLVEAFNRMKSDYNLKEPWMAYIRDVLALEDLGAIQIKKAPGPDTKTPNFSRFRVAIQLGWPTTITETEFFEKTKELPRAKNLNYLSYQSSEKG